MKLIFLCIVTMVGLPGCNVKNKTGNYDFDHQVNFRQNLIEKGKYQLQVISTDKTSFSQLTSFLLRHAYKLCGEYGFTLEVLDGVEGFDDKKISPSYIQPSLLANLTCSVS